MAGVAAMPDGRLVSTGQSGAIHVWTASDPADATVYLRHLGRPVRRIEALADGRLASLGFGGGPDSPQRIHVWDPDEPTTVVVYTGHESHVTALAALPQGHLVSADTAGEIHVWTPDDPNQAAVEYSTTSIERLAAIRGPDGEDLGTVSYNPQDVYERVRNISPDLIIYFGDLLWRSVGSFGHGSTHTFENDTGPDEANHAQDGVLIYYDPKKNLGGHHIKGAQLMDIAPTVLNIMGQSVPEYMQGKVIDL